MFTQKITLHFRHFLLLLILLSPYFSIAQNDWEENIISHSVHDIYKINSADFNNDGDIDVVIATDEYISWFENADGQGRFKAQKRLGQISNSFVFPADIDNDGLIDIIVKSGYFRNLGNSQFSDLIPEYSANFVVLDAADYTGDGFPDLIIKPSATSTSIRLLTNQQDGTFSTAQTLVNLANSVHHLQFGNINGDNLRDILYCDNNSVRVYYFAGGTYSSVSLSVPSGSYAFPAIGDFDQDGDNDIMAQRTVGSVYTLTVLANDNADNWSESLLSAVLTSSINAAATGDFDNDGDTDILFDNDTGSLRGYKNNAGGLSAQVYDSYANSVPLASILSTADLNGDGFADVFGKWDGSSYYHPPFAWYAGKSSGLDYISAIHLDTSTDDFSYATGDLDGDGDQDIIINNFGIKIFENGGEEGMIHYRQLSNRTRGKSTIAMDFDFDGDIDIFGGLSNQEIGWWVNDGTMEFNPMPLYSTTSTTYTYTVAKGDIDGDGDLDFRFQNKWYEYLSNGTFELHDMPISTGDLTDTDGDGDLDLIYVDWADDEIKISKNDGTGVFGELETFSLEFPGNGITRFFFADLNGDGLDDLVYGNYTTGVSHIGCFYNSPTGYSTNQVLVTAGATGIYSVSFCYPHDMDLDGDIDIISSSSCQNGTGCSIFRNDGNGNFADPIWVYWPFPTNNCTSKEVIAADMDGDSVPDAVCHYYGGLQNQPNLNNVSWFKSPLSAPEQTIQSEVQEVSCFDNDTSQSIDDYLTVLMTANSNSATDTYQISAEGFTITPNVGTYGESILFTLEEGSALASEIVLTLSDASNTEIQAETVIVGTGSCSVSSISDFNLLQGMQVSPNPFNDFLNIQLNPEIALGAYALRFSDLHGRVIAEQDITSSEMQLDCREWSEGIYFQSIYEKATGKSLGMVKVIKMR